MDTLARKFSASGAFHWPVSRTLTAAYAVTHYTLFITTAQPLPCPHRCFCWQDTCCNSLLALSSCRTGTEPQACHSHLTSSASPLRHMHATFHMTVLHATFTCMSHLHAGGRVAVEIHVSDFKVHPRNIRLAVGDSLEFRRCAACSPDTCIHASCMHLVCILVVYAWMHP